MVRFKADNFIPVSEVDKVYVHVKPLLKASRIRTLQSLGQDVVEESLNEIKDKGLGFSITKKITNVKPTVIVTLNEKQIFDDGEKELMSNDEIYEVIAEAIEIYVRDKSTMDARNFIVDSLRKHSKAKFDELGLEMTAVLLYGPDGKLLKHVDKIGITKEDVEEG